MKNVLRFLEPVWRLNGQYGSHFDRHFERDFITIFKNRKTATNENCNFSEIMCVICRAIF